MRPTVSLAAVLLIASTLGGCLPDRAKVMAACEKEDARFYATYKAVNPDDPSSQYIIGCMAAKGYEFTIAPEDCDGQHPLPTQATCYVPAGWFDWALFRLRNVKIR
jgi:hypothetical protein